MAGGRRLTRSIRRQPAGGGTTLSTSSPKPSGHHGHSNSVGLQRLKDLQSTLGNQKMQNLLEKKPEPVGDPSVRAELEKLARREFLQVVEQVPTLLGSTSQLLGAQPGPIETSPVLGMAVQAIGVTSTLLARLDAAIEMFERGGGDITEIQTIVAIRAHLSTLIFFLRQTAAGAPLAQMAHQTVLEAHQECMRYQVELSVQAAMKDQKEQGPIPQGEDEKKKALAEVLRRLYLGPPGLSPSSGSLKSLSR